MDAGTWALVSVVGVLCLAVGMLAGLVLSQRRRIEELARPAPVSPAAVVAPVTAPQEAEFVITRVGQAEAGHEAGSVAVENRVVLSATLGEPLVKAVALAHGVRRALSPASRNRILFEVRREVRRTRKERRREMRQAWREMKQQRDAA